MADLKMLAIDLGASSGRGIVGSYDGNKFSIRENHRFPNEPVNTTGNFCWDILRIFHEIKSSISKCILSDDKDIKSIGIDTWGVDYGFVDKNGVLMANPYHYRDARTVGIQPYAFKTVPFEDIYSVTGIQTMNFNTLYQLCADLRDRKYIVDNAKKLLFVPDLLNYFLTGEMLTEYTIASTGAIIDAKKRKIAFDLLNKFGIRNDIFCDLVMPGNRIGKLSEGLRAEIGQLDATVVNVAAHDTASAVIAVPAKKGEDFVYISSGTWSLMGVECDEPVITKESMSYNLTNEGGAERKIRFLKNIMGLWLEQESRRQWKREGLDISFDELTAKALESKPFQCFIDPNNDLFNPQGDMPSRIREFCKKTGQHVPETIGEVVRCIFESLVLCYRQTIEAIEHMTGKHYSSINIVGGGTKEKILCQYAADASNRVVYAGPVEATAMGNIAMQAISSGEIKDVAQAREVIRNSFDIKVYEPHHTAEWEEAYQRYLAICGKEI
ncbi:MAG: rhamnulokinase [Clostridia bacterium]|nr:rhamnulokinase [Clostridia bacterium]